MFHCEAMINEDRKWPELTHKLRQIPWHRTRWGTETVGHTQSDETVAY